MKTPAMTLERSNTDDLAIDRLSVHDMERFRTQYVAGRTPVILTDLFKGQPVEKLADPEQVVRKIGDTPVNITCNYVQHSLEFMKRMLSGRYAGPSISTRSTTVQGYLDLIREDPSSQWILTECPAPQVISEMVDLRPIGISKVICGYPDAASPRDSAAYSLMFVANGGNASDLHTDWDGRDVLLYQVFGQKRVTLFPPESAPRLLPIMVFGTVKLNGMERFTRQEFVRYARGWDDILQPGEAVYMPAFYWHHLEYINVALSFNFRHHGLTNPDALFLLKYAHRDMYLQNLLAATFDEDKRQLVEPLLLSIRNLVEGSPASAREKYRDVSAATLAAYKHIFPNIPGSDSYTWLDCNTFLDGILCSTYMTPPSSLSGLRRQIWIQREKMRFLIRMFGYRIANWA